MLSLLRLGRKQKNYLNPFRIRIFLFLSYSFGIGNDTYVHTLPSSLENHTQFPTKMDKVFQTKRRQTLPNGEAHTYMAYIREYPSGSSYSEEAQPFYLRRRNSKSGIIIAFAGLKTPTDNADRLLNASLSRGRPPNVRVCRLFLMVKILDLLFASPTAIYR